MFSGQKDQLGEMSTLLPHRKLSEPPNLSQIIFNQNNLTKPKPCLKRRSSVPARPDLLVQEKLGSCESLETSSVVSTDSSIGSSTKKSVFFADSIGENLCHIKLFTKELCEVLDEDSWMEKMRRWQRMMTMGSVEPEEADWDSFDQEDLDELYDNFDTEFPLSRLDDQQNVVDDEDEEDYPIYCNSLSQMSCPTNLGCQNQTSGTANDSPAPNTVIIPTFLSPHDVPGYPERLAKSGICLESVSVIPDQSMISGTIGLACSKGFKVVDSSPTVSVTYSFDNWATSTRGDTTAFCLGEKYGFVISTKKMESGDDLEMLVTCQTEEGSELLRDDNEGLKYRFICKNKPKFSPGKSLW